MKLISFKLSFCSEDVGTEWFATQLGKSESEESIS